MRKVLKVALVLGLIAVVGHLGIRKYVSLRQTRLLRQADQYLTKSDGKKALLCLQRALRHNPKDPKACRLMAQLTEAARSPATLLWRSRVVELDPRSTDDRLALARTALMLRDLTIATNALEGLDPAGKETATYHNLAGSVAAAAGQLPRAEAHFLEAARLEPTNPAPQLNLAVVRLQQTNTSAQTQARASLKELCANPLLRNQALRELVGDALRHRNTNDALAMSRQLVQQTNCAFADKIMHLGVLRAAQSPDFKPALAACQREAGAEPARISELAVWQTAMSGPAETLAWLESLPAAAQTNQPTALIEAECRTALKNWPALQTSLQNQDWTELEFMRHAYLARAMRGQELAAASKTEWEQALKAARGQKSSLVMLLRLAAQWNWLNEGEDILWTFVNQHPGETWALRALGQSLFVGGRTRSLLTLYGKQAKANPSDLGARNNLAMTALLLDAQDLKPHDLAREVYLKAPTNSAFASTYAFSLHVQEKDAEALKLIEQLPPQALEDPGIAGYYGIILKANGNAAKAKKYLQLASKARLLPEEKKLIEQASQGI